MWRRLQRRFLLSAWNIFLKGESTLSKSLAKLFYLEQLRTNPNHHRLIANRMTERFAVSPAQIRDELVDEGYIALDKVVRMGETRKNNYFYVLTGKKLELSQEPEKKIVSVDYWSCGTKKSKGNAFDLSMAKGLFNKTELAASVNKGKPNNYNSTVRIIAYSRA
jgi:hypothetical protein